MKFFAKTAGKCFEVEVTGPEEEATVLLNGEKKHVDLKRIENSNLFSLIVDNRSYRIFIEPGSQGYEVLVNGEPCYVELEDEKTRLLKSFVKSKEKSRGATEVKAPMPGSIVKFQVKEGQAVKKGDGLVIIEAMKMENEIRAHVDGVVKKIFRKAKESVEKDSILLVIE